MPTSKDKRRAKQSSARDKVNVSATAIAGGAGAALAAGASPLVAGLLGAGAGTAGPLLAMVGGWLQEKRERRLSGFLGEYYRAGPAADPDAVEAELHARSEDPLIQELVIEGLRAVDEVLADAVVPVLARLTREYVSNARGADWFFRGVRRVLSDLTNEEFEALRSIVQRVVAVGIPTAADPLRLEHHEGHPSKPEGLTCNWTEEPEDGGKASWAGRKILGDAPHARRLFYLLKANGLGEDAPTGGFTSTGGPGVVYVPREVIDRLWVLLG